jgi:hypothetical protein
MQLLGGGGLEMSMECCKRGQLVLVEMGAVFEKGVVSGLDLLFQHPYYVYFRCGNLMMLHPLLLILLCFLAMFTG